MAVATPELAEVISSQERDQSLEQSVLLLKKCWDKEISLVRDSEVNLSEQDKELCRMAKHDVQAIRKIINDVYAILQSPVGNDRHIVLLKKADFLARGVVLTEQYLSLYKSVLHSQFIEELELTLDNFSFNYYPFKGLGLLGQAPTCKKVLEQFKKYAQGMKFLRIYVETALEIKPDIIMDSHEKGMFDLICNTNIKYKYSSDSEMKILGISNSKRYKILKLKKRIQLDSFEIIRLIGRKESDLSDIRVVADPEICGGLHRLSGTRTTVKTIVLEIKSGHTPEQIQKNRSHLTLNQINMALEFYKNNPDLIDSEIAKIDDEYKNFSSSTLVEKFG